MGSGKAVRDRSPSRLDEDHPVRSVRKRDSEGAQRDELNHVCSVGDSFSGLLLRSGGLLCLLALRGGRRSPRRSHKRKEPKPLGRGPQPDSPVRGTARPHTGNELVGGKAVIDRSQPRLGADHPVRSVRTHVSEGAHRDEPRPKASALSQNRRKKSQRTFVLFLIDSTWTVFSTKLILW